MAALSAHRRGSADGPSGGAVGRAARPDWTRLPAPRTQGVVGRCDSAGRCDSDGAGNRPGSSTLPGQRAAPNPPLGGPESRGHGPESREITMIPRHRRPPAHTVTYAPSPASRRGVASLREGHGVATASPRRRHGVATVLSRRRHGVVTASPRRRHGVVTASPRRRHGVVTASSRRRHGVARHEACGTWSHTDAPAPQGRRCQCRAS
jgi:hypothetical protein